MNMRKIAIAFMLLAVCCTAAAQSAKTVLDKAAAVIGSGNGVTASFRTDGKQYGNTSGTIMLKKKLFHISTPQAAVWFNGKTMWTYVKKNNEVNVSNPTARELQAINPYNFINMYSKGFSYKMDKAGSEYVVHLTATGKSQGISEMVISVNRSTYVISKIKIKQGQAWSTISISNFRKAALSDSKFSFSPKLYPGAEVIDLR